MNRSWVIIEYLPNTITVATLNVIIISSLTNSIFSVEYAFKRTNTLIEDSMKWKKCLR